jgi:hypothetical protein
VIAAFEGSVVAKTRHGGDRSGAGRPRGDRDDVSVKLDRVVATRALFVAKSRGIPIAEYLTESVRATVDRDFDKASKDKGVDMTKFTGVLYKNDQIVAEVKGEYFPNAGSRSGYGGSFTVDTEVGAAAIRDQGLVLSIKDGLKFSIDTPRSYFNNESKTCVIEFVTNGPPL